ncbi:MAG: VWA domain-containing protein [Gemmatimonadetes bacterium]|nr:VWA domain-containing protein [Gemmatimonadota bacterium]
MRAHVSAVTTVRRLLRRLAMQLRNETGAVLVIIAGGMVILLGMAGLVLDSGRAFVARSELSRAVDAGVLAGARALRSGESSARNQALAVSRANGVLPDDPRTKVDVVFGINADGDNTVTVTATRPMRTSLMRLLGRNWVDVGSTATAVVPPVDLIFVVDQSGSLGTAGAWDDLQDAARSFVDFFSDDLDQLSVVSFGTRGETRLPLQAPFRTAAKSQIDRMASVGWTNTAEGLQLAYDQLTGKKARDRAVKVVVFFTDGRPTAFRGTIGGDRRIMAVAANEWNVVRGYFDNPDDIPMDRWQWPADDACRNVVNCKIWKEGGHPPHGVRGRQIARDMGLAAANQIRNEDAFVYAIGLGNPLGSKLERPDTDYLSQLANEHGSVNSNQPAGRMYFAPSAAELRDVFQRVAGDLVIRLSR